MRLIFPSTRYSIYKISELEYTRARNDMIASPFFCVTKTPKEISVLAKSALFKAPIAEERGWRMFYVSGTISFETTGVLASLLTPLAAKKVSILAVSTFDTDYVFFKEPFLKDVKSSLKEIGFSISEIDS